MDERDAQRRAGILAIQARATKDARAQPKLVLSAG
jgi:hypothetical protein